MPIPAPLAADYRPATSREIRSWSFGALTSPRAESATFYDNVRGTLNDQRIFGPIDDFRCGCGKFVGDRYQGMICDRCGVKIDSSAIRAARFGHIEFDAAVRHPFAPDCELNCFPVIPIAFIESPGGRRLPDLYDRLVVAANTESVARVSESVDAIVDQLTPPAITLHEWRLDAAEMFAHGLALELTS